MVSMRSIIHMFDPMQHVSPFDVNMAVDAGFDVVVPYSNVKLEEVHGLIQDAIFSRSPKSARYTAAFIGGRDIHLAMRILAQAEEALVPPFEISIMVDPSGSFTTAAALVACVEKVLKEKHQMALSDCRAVVLGGTGTVGIATGVIASLAGADTTLVHHKSIERAQELADEYNKLCGATMRGSFGASDADKVYLVDNADIVFCTAKAGVEILDDRVIGSVKTLKVAADVNAVEPYGIRDIGLKDFGEPLKHAKGANDAVGIGALAIGEAKSKVQNALLKSLLDQDKAVSLDFRTAFEKARELV